MAVSSSARMAWSETARIAISSMPCARAKRTASATSGDTSSVIRTMRTYSRLRGIVSTQRRVKWG